MTPPSVSEIDAVLTRRDAPFEIETIHIGRKDAEATYGNIIYDKFPVPAHIQHLSLARIKDWNINCCLGPHVKTTGEIGAIKIASWRHRQNRSELEISFDVA